MKTPPVEKLFAHGKDRLLLGLTGAAASGKSLASGYFKKLGAEVICADTLARRALEPGKPAWRAVRARYGAEALSPDGSIRRDFLAARVFSEPAERKWLEKTVHPHVIIESSEVFRTTNCAITVLDAPLLFEAGLRQACDLTVCIHSNKGPRLKRALSRGWSAKEFELRCAAQLSADEKAALSDLTIENSGTKSQLSQKITRLYKALLILK